MCWVLVLHNTQSFLALPFLWPFSSIVWGFSSEPWGFCADSQWSMEELPPCWGHGWSRIWDDRGTVIAKEQMALLYQLVGPGRKIVESLWQFNWSLGKILLFFLTSLMLRRFPWYLHLKCQHSWWLSTPALSAARQKDFISSRYNRKLGRFRGKYG